MKPSWLVMYGVIILSLWYSLIDYVEGNFQWFNWDNLTHWEITIPMIIIVVITYTYIDRNYEVKKIVKT